MSTVSPVHYITLSRKISMKTFAIMFLVTMTVLTVTLVAICSQVTLPEHRNQAPTVRPLPLTDTVSKLPNGNLVQFVGAKFMAPAAVDIQEFYSTENT